MTGNLIDSDSSTRRVSLDVSAVRNGNNNNNNSLGLGLDRMHPTVIPTTTTTSMDSSSTPMIMMPTGTGTTMLPSTSSTNNMHMSMMAPDSSCWQQQQAQANMRNAMNQSNHSVMSMSNLSNNNNSNSHNLDMNCSNHSSATTTDMMQPILPIPPVSFFPTTATPSVSVGPTRMRQAGGMPNIQQQQQSRRASAPGFFGNGSNHSHNSSSMGASPRASDVSFHHSTPSLHHPHTRKLSLPLASNSSEMLMPMMNNNSDHIVPSFGGGGAMNEMLSSSSFHGHMPTAPHHHGSCSDMDDSSNSAYYSNMGNTSNHSRRSSMGGSARSHSSRRASSMSHVVGVPPPPPSYNNGTQFGPRKNRVRAASLTDAPETTTTTKAMRPRPPGMLSFPTKLHQILDNPKYQDYISWMPHGRSWRILKAKAFEVNVLPKHFRSARYASFMRQVNGWGFRRMTEGPDLNAYFHPCFVKGMPELCEDMRRPQKGQNPLEWAEDYPDKNPDFYKIQAIIPLPTATTEDSGADAEKEEGESKEERPKDKKKQKPSLQKKQELVPEVSESSFGTDETETQDILNLSERSSERSQNRKRNREEASEADRESEPPTAVSKTQPEEEEEEEVLQVKDDDELPMMPSHRSSLLDLDDDTVASWGDDFSEAQAGDDESVRQDVFASPPRKIRIGGRRSGADATPPSAISTSTSADSSRGTSPAATSSAKNHLIAPSLSEEEAPSLVSSSSSSLKGGLSKADLSYLAWQNKLLLRQTQLLQRQKERQQEEKGAATAAEENANASKD